jgi:hypothetical protein
MDKPTVSIEKNVAVMPVFYLEEIGDNGVSCNKIN